METGRAGVRTTAPQGMRRSLVSSRRVALSPGLDPGYLQPAATAGACRASDRITSRRVSQPSEAFSPRFHCLYKSRL